MQSHHSKKGTFKDNYFEAKLQVSEHPEKKGWVLLEPSIHFKEKEKQEAKKQKPHHVISVLDVSDSMVRTSPEPYTIQVLDPDVKIAAITPTKGILYVQQNKDDKGIVTYRWLKTTKSGEGGLTDNGLRVQYWNQEIIQDDLTVTDFGEGTMSENQQTHSRIAVLLKKGLKQEDMTPGVSKLFLHAAKTPDTFEADALTYLQGVYTDTIKKLSPEKFKLSLILFSGEAKVKATNASGEEIAALFNQQETIKSVPERDKTNLSAGLLAINGEMLGEDKEGNIDETNSTILFFTDGRKTHGFTAEETINRLRKRFNGKSIKIIPVGLGDYDDKELFYYGKQTEGFQYNLKSGNEIKNFFHNTFIPLLGKRVPAKLQISVNHKICQERHLKGGMVINQPWDQVFEVNLNDSLLGGKPIPYVMRYTIDGQTIELKGTWTAKELAKSNLPVIERFIAQKISQIYNDAAIPKHNKILKLQELLKLISSITNKGEAEQTKNNIQEALYWLQPLEKFQGSEQTLNQKMLEFSSKTANAASSTAYFKLKFYTLQKFPYNPETNILLYQKDPYRVINREIDFIHGKCFSEDKENRNDKINGLISLDAGITNREGVILSQAFFTKFVPSRAQLINLATRKSIENKLSAITSFVKSQLKSDDISKVVGNQFPKDTMRAFPLEDFIIKGVGKCRHHALYTAALIRELTLTLEAGNLPNDGEVRIRRHAAWNLKNHTWVMYKTGSAVYLIDSSLPDKQIYNLKDPSDAEEVLKVYEKQGLAGILVDVFEENSIIPPHPKLTEIDDKAIELLVKDEETAENNLKVFENYLCPISNDIMRKPVRLRCKDGSHFYFDLTCLEEWFKTKRNKDRIPTNPLTNMELSAEELTIRVPKDKTQTDKKLSPEDEEEKEAPGIYFDSDKAQEIWDLLITTAERLPEDSVATSLAALNKTSTADRSKKMSLKIQEDISKLKHKNDSPYYRPDLLDKPDTTDVIEEIEDKIQSSSQMISSLLQDAPAKPKLDQKQLNHALVLELQKSKCSVERIINLLTMGANIGTQLSKAGTTVFDRILLMSNPNSARYLFDAAALAQITQAAGFTQSQKQIHIDWIQSRLLYTLSGLDISDAKLNSKEKFHQSLHNFNLTCDEKGTTFKDYDGFRVYMTSTEERNFNELLKGPLERIKRFETIFEDMKKTPVISSKVETVQYTKGFLDSTLYLRQPTSTELTEQNTIRTQMINIVFEAFAKLTHPQLCLQCIQQQLSAIAINKSYITLLRFQEKLIADTTSALKTLSTAPTNVHKVVAKLAV